MASTIRNLDDQAIRPLVLNTVRVPESDLVFTAACFEGSSWSLAPLKEPSDLAANWAFGRRIASAVRGLGGKRAYAPYPAKFNGMIIERDRLWKKFSLPEDVALFRNNDMPADGTFLRESGDAGIFSAAGCAVIVAIFGNRMVFAHAGRDCVLDRKLIETDGKEHGRRNESVVNSIVEALGPELPSELKGFHAWVFYSIKPEDFPHELDHPDYQAWNHGAAAYLPRQFGQKAARVDAKAVYPDIPEIAKAQFMRYGVPEGNIHLEHAYLADELPNTRKGVGRYLTAVVRYT